MRHLPRRFTYAAIAAVLALGAPIGLFAVRRAVAPPATPDGMLVRSDLPAFVYVTVSTLLVFCAFGYVLGRQADALVALARTDPLTGLLNPRAYGERLSDEVGRAARYGAPLSLLMLDVDRLKAINDRGGHRAGDAALSLVADALRQDARRSDFAARIGGDEFAVIAPSTDERHALALAERIRSRVEDKGGGLTVSIGVATLDPGGPSAAALRDGGDAALYEAKRRGRNQVAAGGAKPPWP
jgi:diguanylate cyclase (GGDEF)-like protein